MNVVLSGTETLALVCVSASINNNMDQKESRGACYGVMSGLISQPCLRLITQVPLGGDKMETRRGEMKRPNWEQSLPVSSPLRFTRNVTNL